MLRLNPMRLRRFCRVLLWSPELFGMITGRFCCSIDRMRSFKTAMPANTASPTGHPPTSRQSGIPPSPMLPVWLRLPPLQDQMAKAKMLLTVCEDQQSIPHCLQWTHERVTVPATAVGNPPVHQWLWSSKSAFSSKRKAFRCCGKWQSWVFVPILARHPRPQDLRVFAEGAVTLWRHTIQKPDAAMVRSISKIELLKRFISARAVIDAAAHHRRKVLHFRSKFWQGSLRNNLTLLQHFIKLCRGNAHTRARQLKCTVKPFPQLPAQFFGLKPLLLDMICPMARSAPFVWSTESWSTVEASAIAVKSGVNYRPASSVPLAAAAICI